MLSGISKDERCERVEFSVSSLLVSLINTPVLPVCCRSLSTESLLTFVTSLLLIICCVTLKVTAVNLNNYNIINSQKWKWYV